MKISEYITALESILSQHGDLDVQKVNLALHRVNAGAPSVGFELVLRGKESRPRFWSSYNGEDRKGRKVCEV